MSPKSTEPPSHPLRRPVEAPLSVETRCASTSSGRRLGVALTFVLLGAACRAAAPETEQVLVAATELAEGATLLEADVRTAELALGLAGPGALRPKDLGRAVGRTLLAGVPRGALLQASVLRAPSDLARLVAPKARGFTLAIAGAEWCREGDHVDVIGIFPDPSTGERGAVTLVQNVIVLAVGAAEPRAPAQRLAASPQHTDGPAMSDPRRDGGAAAAAVAPWVAMPALRRVTLLLLPEEGEIVHEGATAGVLHLGLRHPEDVDLLEDRGRATINTLLSAERRKVLLRKRADLAPAPPEPPEPKPPEDDRLPYWARRAEKEATP